jgi:hypothetical protein
MLPRTRFLLGIVLIIFALGPVIAAPLAFAQGSIYGTVFEDLNANGLRDSGEPGISGVTVTLANSTDTQANTTDSSGQYAFPITETGSYTITEQDPAGYVSTNAIPGNATTTTRFDNNTLQVEVNSLGVDYGNNTFGDVQSLNPVTIRGMVWDDNGAGEGGVPANGIPDGTEPGLAGAVISLTSGTSMTTGSDGLFELYGPANAPGNITRTNPPGYFSTDAIPGNNATKIDHDTLKQPVRGRSPHTRHAPQWHRLLRCG